MPDEVKDFDPIWEDFYAKGQYLNKYPFNHVPNYFFRHRPQHKDIKQTRVLEVGFGAGNNLWMCAREGAQVSGVDAAKSGVKFANERFKAHGLSGDLRVGDFCQLPFQDGEFDMAINRQALTQVSHSRAKTAVQEIHRCLAVGGTFWSNMFSDCSLHNGRDLGDGLWGDIKAGLLQGVGQTAFHSKSQVLDMYGAGWTVEELIHDEQTHYTRDNEFTYAEWRITARKTG